MDSYTRGERMLFHFLDFSINAVSTLFLGLAYLASAFALFGAATSLYAWYGFHDATLASQFVRFGGMLLLYVAAPLTALMCLTVFAQQAWRSVWRARPVFEEKRMHPAFVFLLFVACSMFTYAANDSVEGRWAAVPARAAEILQVRPERGLKALQPIMKPLHLPVQATEVRPEAEANVRSEVHPSPN